MKDEETVAILRRMISAAQENGPDPDAQKKAIDYYYGRQRGDEMIGRSQVQSLDVADMVNSTMSQILPSFTQDTVCQFEADGPDDEIPARMESDATNRVMMESQRGYTVFYEALKDALLLKNGIIKAYLDEKGDQRQIRLEAVDPLSFYVGEDQSCILLDEYRSSFCAERKCYTRGELVEMGLSRDKIEQIPQGDDDVTTSAYARNKGGQVGSEVQAGWALEEVTIWEIYARLADDDDSAKVRLYRCLLGGQVLLLKEPTDYLPYAAGSAFPEPHKFWGLSFYDRLRSIQDSKTAIKRAWLDNLANCNNSRTAINDSVNVDDALNGRPGGLIRIQGMGPPAEAIMPITVIDAGPAAQAFLAYEDQVRADRGGASLEMASGEMQVAQGQIGSMGVDRIYSVQEALAGMIARTLAETLLRSTFMLVHRLLRTEYAEPLTLRMADQWVQVDPSKWRRRDRVNIRSGLSPGERSRKAQAMTQVLQMQSQALQMGMDGVLVTLPNLYNAYLDWASSNELDAGEKYFTDPRSQSSMQAGQSKAQQGQQQMQMQMQMAQAQLSIENMKVQMDKYKADLDAKVTLQVEALHAEIEEAKLVGQATADLQLAELQARSAAATGNGAGDTGAGGSSAE